MVISPRVRGFGFLVAGALVIASAAETAIAQPCPSCVLPSFGPATRAFSAGSTAKFVAAGDFNNDRIPDLAADGGSLKIYLGTGSGTFQPPTSLPYADPRAIATGDFNHDGNLDLAIGAEGVLYVLLGDGTGAFPNAWQGGYGVERIAVGDFNGDGILDLVTNGSFTNGLTYWRGGGNGVFTAIRTYHVAGPVSFDGVTLRVADLNGDHIDDIAADSVGGGQILILLGDPLFGPQPFDTFSAGAYGGEMAIGDLAEDGIPDLLVEIAQGFGGQRSLAVFRGNGDGTFQGSAPFAVGYNIHLDLGDLNGDGHLDIGMYKRYDSDIPKYGAFVYLGTGQGTFDSPVNTLMYEEAAMVVAADVDGDHRADLVIPTFAQDGVNVLISADDGHFREAPRYSAGIPDAVTAVGADFNGDGRPDVAVSGAIEQVAILLGKIDGGFQDPIVTTASYLQDNLVAADFTGDGKIDLAYSGAFEKVYVLPGLGNGSFGAAIQTPILSNGQSELVAGGFHNNGRQDLLQTTYAGQLYLYPSNGDGTFGSAATISTVARYTAVSLIDADANLDVAFIDQDVSGHSLHVRLGNGSGGFGSDVVTPLGSIWASALALADMNGDGKRDAIVGDLTEGVAVLLGDGSGSFGAPAEIPTNRYPRNLQIADVNGDGIPDVVLATGPYVLALAGVGDGTLMPAEMFALPGYPVGIVPADYDQDARTDVAVACIGTVYTPPDFVAVMTNTLCLPSRLVVAQQPQSCATPGSPFATQPVVHVLDDGDNVICDDGTVAASIKPGTGTPGASLLGATSVAAVSGVATFTNLAIDAAGRGYRLRFTHSAADPVDSRTLSQGLAVSIVGPSSACSYPPIPFETVLGGYDSYYWTVDGIFFSQAEKAALDRWPGGNHTVQVTVLQDGCEASASTGVMITTSPVAPAIDAPLFAAVGETGLLGHVAFPEAGHSYAWSIEGGTITGGADTETVTFDAGPPGTRMMLHLVDTSPDACFSPPAGFPVQVEFADVAATDPFRPFIDTIAYVQITAGCGNGNFCPTAPVTRAQMAVFLLRAMLGGTYEPPPCAGNVFQDVPCQGGGFDPWIEDLANRGITTGCGNFNYCPDAPVTRAQMAPFLLKSSLGPTYLPPTCSGTVFDDVPCSGGAFDPWIEDMAARHITGGCSVSPALYCPDNPNTRGQMAVFLIRAFPIP